MEGFEVISDKEFLHQIFQEWNTNPNYSNIDLYLAFLRFKRSWPTPDELEEWKLEAYLNNIQNICNVEDLHNTLDNQDDINSLCQRLDEFSNIVMTQEVEIKKKWEEEKINFDSKMLTYYSQNDTNTNYLFKYLNSWWNTIYDYSKYYLEYIL
jgi:hypothetical protein|tara:strand:- start:867 stop:1325 length:459 start_codon:yes stop_codon:yes gene_type:complete